MKAQDAIGQLLKEKNDLQIFAHQVVGQYNQNAERPYKLSLACDDLLKAASEHQSQDWEHCKILVEKLNTADSLNLEQHTVGEKMIQSFKNDIEEYKRSLHIQQDVTRHTEERYREINGFNMRWEVSFKNLEADFAEYEKWANTEITSSGHNCRKKRAKHRQRLYKLLP